MIDVTIHPDRVAVVRSRGGSVAASRSLATLDDFEFTPHDWLPASGGENPLEQLLIADSCLERIRLAASEVHRYAERISSLSRDCPRRSARARRLAARALAEIGRTSSLALDGSLHWRANSLERAASRLARIHNRVLLHG